MKWYRNKQMLNETFEQNISYLHKTKSEKTQWLLMDYNNLILDHLELLDENERLKKHNGRLTRKIQKLYDEHVNLICESSLLRSNNEALLKLIGGIEVINNE